jgi:glycosyltransferase involved in cell wall biosynthesis
MKTIVLSGINLFRGGTLKIMQDCIAAFSAQSGGGYRIFALVHDEKQYPELENVTYYSFPKSRKSWLYRLYYEYIGFKKLSEKWKPYIWFSLHDTTPNVIADKRMVYCHNTFSFYHAGIKGLFTQPSIFMFSLFSKYIHKINIKKNDWVVVQQEWLRKAFQRMYSIRNIIVALPVQEQNNSAILSGKNEFSKEQTIFFYPATPMIHKNFEVICKAAFFLKKAGISNFEVVLTLDGTENKYAKQIYNKYKSLENLRFVGLLKREDVDVFYRNSDCLLFPSKIESWGLPVTEAKEYNKSILIADLPYAKESVGKYDKAKFFDPDNTTQLANSMKNLIQGIADYDKTETVEYQKPFTRNWDELVRFLLKEGNS